MLDRIEFIKENVPTSFNSDHLYYRIMTLEDTEKVVNLRNAKHVRDNYIYQKPITYKEHTNYFKTKIETGTVIQYVMLEKNTDKAIGCVFIKDVDLENKSAEYGVFIGDIDALGKGYGLEALEQMKVLCFEGMKLDKLSLRVLSFNEIAIKIYKKAGFEEIDRIIDKDGNREIILMELVNKRGLL